MLLGLAGAVHASTTTVYGISGGSLYQITDFTNWTTVLVGTTGGITMSDVAINAAGTTIYGVDFFSGAGSSRLYGINPANGATSIIGATGVSFLNGLAISAGGVLYASDQFNGNIYTINPLTGVATLLGTNPGITSTGDLEFANGNLYMDAIVGGRTFLYSVNTATGAATPLNANNPICTGGNGTGTCYSNIEGLAFVNNTTLYGFTTGGVVVSIDLNTGLVTSSHFYAPGFDGASEFNGTGIAPEPGPLSTALLGLSIGGFALWRRRANRP